MNVKKVIFALFMALLPAGIYAQKLITDGVIVFEKTVNKYAVLSKIMKTYDAEIILQEELAQYRRTHQQFLKLQSTLTFSKSRTLFVPIKYTGDPNENLWNGKQISDQGNSVFSNFIDNTTIAKKKVLGIDFLIKDSLRAITWKITNETREIAGFSCQRANGLVMDSVYVVAFYTNQIPIASGPESFSGLPGMILGVALPYENISWFAVSITETKEKNIDPPKEGKLSSYGHLRTVLEDAFRGNNARMQLMLKAFLL